VSISGRRSGSNSPAPQLTTLYSCEELIGRQVLAVLNFPRKQIGNFFSEVLVTVVMTIRGESF